MSPRAAWRLERLGFAPVYDYMAGKVDWMAAGLPTVRAHGSGDRAIDAADTEPRTCAPDQPVATLGDDLGGSAIVVVNDERIVLGRIDAVPLIVNANATAADIMSPGPTTVRAHESLPDLLNRMATRGVREMIVTTPEGRLLGVIHTKDAES